MRRLIVIAPILELAGFHVVTLMLVAGWSGVSRNQKPETRNNKTKTRTTMKKLLLIAAVIVTTLGAGYAANCLHNIADHSDCKMGTRCTSCNGTGWNNSGTKCFACKGTGANSCY